MDDLAALDDRSVRCWTNYPLPVPQERIRSWLVEDASIPDRVHAWAVARADKVALEVDGDAVTYEELTHRAASVGAWLAARGVARGDRVVVVGGNSVEFIVACLGAMWCGGVQVVANPTLTERELVHIVEDAAAAAVLGDEGPLTTLGAHVEGIPTLVLRGDGPHSLASAVASSVPLLPPELDSRDLHALQYTSGTTGAPKGVRLTYACLVAYLRSVLVSWEWTSDDVLLHSLPMSHGHGLNGVFTALLAGATAVVLPRTDPERIMAELVGREATIFYSVPTIWTRLLDSPRFDPRAFAGLRFYTSGSAPLAAEVSDRITDRLGDRPLERYGATESGLLVTNPLHGPRYGGTVGLPVPGAEVRVVDEQGVPVSDGEIGEIVGRGPAVCDGYWRREAPDMFFEGGWYRTGDLGMFDPARGGHLVVSGRTKDMIITGGLNVYPAEVEFVAERFPLVREAAAIGVPSTDWGEEVALVVVPVDGALLDASELLAWMRTQLAAYKVPKQCRVVDALPRNHVGKIVRGDLVHRWVGE